MKYESKRFDERWGSQQARAKQQNVNTVLTNGTSETDLNFGSTWTNPQVDNFWDSATWVPVQGDVAGHPGISVQIAADPTAKNLREALSVCVVCGLDDVFVLCSLCREAVREARKDMLNGMVESIRSMIP